MWLRVVRHLFPQLVPACASLCQLNTTPPTFHVINLTRTTDSFLLFPPCRFFCFSLLRLARVLQHAQQWYFTQQFDVDKTGALEASQLGKFMQDMAHHDGHGQMSEQELSSAVAFIMKAADADRSGSIDEEELKHAVSAWKNWSHSATRLSEKVKELLLKYDTDMSGSLDRAQLLAMLTHLNEDTPVTEAEASEGGSGLRVQQFACYVRRSSPAAARRA